MKTKKFEAHTKGQKEKGLDRTKPSLDSRKEKTEETLVSQNLEVKQKMAQELLAMGLSRESVSRVLRLPDQRNEQGGDRGNGR